MLIKTCLLFDSIYTLNKRGPTKRILLKDVFIPKLLINPIVSCSLISTDVLLSRGAHFDKFISFPFKKIQELDVIQV